MSDDQTWVDPIVGLALRTAPGRLLQARVYSEIGGFGLGSDFGWQIFPTVGINFSERFSLDVGYRWLDIDYSSGEGGDRFTYDVMTQGIMVGCSLRY